MGLRKLELFMIFKELGLFDQMGYLGTDHYNCLIWRGLRKGMRYFPKNEQKGGPLLETLT